MNTYYSPVLDAGSISLLGVDSVDAHQKVFLSVKNLIIFMNFNIIKSVCVMYARIYMCFLCSVGFSLNRANTVCVKQTF